MKVTIGNYITPKQEKKNPSRKRKIKVKIDPFDIWSMDHTLAFVILPMLQMLKKDKHGSPFVDDADVPDHLKSTSYPKPKDNDVDDGFHLRWDYVVDSMIYSFSTLVDETYEDQFYVNESYDVEKWEKDAEKVQNGFRLFGKYYNGLWT